MQRETQHARSTSSIPGLRTTPLKKPTRSRTPTVELKQMDEGYESMPLLKQEIDRIAHIDDGQDSSLDTTHLELQVPVAIGLQKWTAFSDVVEHIELQATVSQQQHTSSCNPLIVVEDSSSETPTSPRTRWSLMPLIERLLGDRKGRADATAIGVPGSPASIARRKGVSGLPRSTYLSRLPTKLAEEDETSDDDDDEESAQHEQINISDDAPDFTSDQEEINALTNTKLFAAKYRDSTTQIGTGGHSTVRLATRISDGRLVVCKFMQHTSVWNWYYSTKLARKIPLEIHLLKKFAGGRGGRRRRQQQQHPGIIGFIEHFEMAGKYVIVMEYMGDEWVDLYEYIEVYGPVVQEHAREIFERVVETVEYMHKLGYTHNDIKDENILINKTTRQIKLIDFGSTTQYTRDTPKFTLFYGTKKFASPEALSGQPYDASAQEVWCLGTLLYVLLFKMDPFKDDAEIGTLDIGSRIARLRASGRANGGADISDAAVLLLERMMCKDPGCRIACREILGHEFVGCRAADGGAAL